jgi:arabinogalactan oligomer/maltooligosaccharide transport system substrate-binding protein
VSAFFVPRKGSNRQLAHDFLLNYLTRTDLAIALYKADNRPPALNLAVERLGVDPVVDAFASAAANGVPMPSWPEMPELFKLIGRAEAMVIAGEPVEPTVASLSREVADTMSRGGRLPRQRGSWHQRRPPRLTQYTAA